MLKKLGHYEAERCYYKCSHLPKDLPDPAPSGLMSKTFASLKENERQDFQNCEKGEVNRRRVGLTDTHFHEIFELSSSYSDESDPLSHVELKMVVKRRSKQASTGVCPARRDNTGGSGLKRVVQASAVSCSLLLLPQCFLLSSIEPTV